MRFRKKPVVIEATQWWKAGDHPGVEIVECSADFEYQLGRIKTLEGWMTVRQGDWVITGVKGEHYPCKSDIFAATYEPVE